MIVKFDLGRWIASFDFFSWLVIMAAAGATEVVIDDRRIKDYKWPRDICLRRIESIIMPGPALAGLSCRTGSDGREWGLDPDLSSLVRHMRAGKPIARLRSVLPPGTARYTVTMRETQRCPERNSSPAWRTFAARIGAVVIEDYDAAPIGLHERMALYAGARMNFFVVSGPGHLCMLAGYPCMVFDGLENAPSFARSGIAVGESLPWQGPDQHFLWQPDDLHNIEFAFETWEQARAA